MRESRSGRCGNRGGFPVDEYESHILFFGFRDLSNPDPLSTSKKVEVVMRFGGNSLSQTRKKEKDEQTKSTNFLRGMRASPERDKHPVPMRQHQGGNARMSMLQRERSCDHD